MDPSFLDPWEIRVDTLPRKLRESYLEESHFMFWSKEQLQFGLDLCFNSTWKSIKLIFYNGIKLYPDIEFDFSFDVVSMQLILELSLNITIK